MADAGAARLVDQLPWWRPGAAFGYHGLTIGTLASELVRRITGLTLHTESSSRSRARISPSVVSAPSGTTAHSARSDFMTPRPASASGIPCGARRLPVERTRGRCRSLPCSSTSRRSAKRSDVQQAGVIAIDHRVQDSRRTAMEPDHIVEKSSGEEGDALLLSATFPRRPTRTCCSEGDSTAKYCSVIARFFA